MISEKERKKSISVHPIPKEYKKELQLHGSYLEAVFAASSLSRNFSFIVICPWIPMLSLLMPKCHTLWVSLFVNMMKSVAHGWGQRRICSKGPCVSECKWTDRRKWAGKKRFNVSRYVEWVRERWETDGSGREYEEHTDTLSNDHLRWGVLRGRDGEELRQYLKVFSQDVM